MMKAICLAAVLYFAGTLAWAAPQVHLFKKIQATEEFWAEGADIGDFNHDKKMDVVSGPYWYEGPDFKKRHEYDATRRTSPAGVAPFKLKRADGTEETVEGFEGALGQNNTYSGVNGGAWLRPTGIIPPRFIKFNARWDF